MGIPISIKDLYGVSGYKTYAGTPSALPIKWEVEGPIVKNTQKQCALITGKPIQLNLLSGDLELILTGELPIKPMGLKKSSCSWWF